MRLAVIPDYAFPEDVLRRVPFPVLMIKKRAKPTTPTDQDNSDQLALDMQSSVAEASCVDLNPIDGMDGCVY
ncbi:hypothetical protein EON65_27680 [archaeon]|nr:MAG: hypothetical protein EON65_27680 [archaeon]